MSDLFITGTDTEVGKTVLSALLTAALDAAYWKPIQTGFRGGAEETDRQRVIRYAGIDPSLAPPESYIFDPPVSPHLAARLAGITIDPERIVRPDLAGRRLIIEGAGGVLAPVNDSCFMLDLMRRLAAPVVVATRTSLGTINHTLLTVRELRRAGLVVAGLVLIGAENPDNRDAIERYGQARVVGWIPPLERFDRESLTGVFRKHFDPRAFDV